MQVQGSAMNMGLTSHKHIAHKEMENLKKKRNRAIGEIFYYLVRSCILSTTYNQYDQCNMMRLQTYHAW